MQTILVTGGAGFIGSHLIRALIREGKSRVINLDLMTYAGDLTRLSDIEKNPAYNFVRGDIRDENSLNRLFSEHNIDCVIHCAAESHVDRGFRNPILFYSVNVLGTLALLETARQHWGKNSAGIKRFLNVSTDEVYGDALFGDYFTEDAPLRPNHPYAASKAAGDLLVLSYVKTYGFPGLITRSTNTFGPAQHPEKLVPHVINAIHEDRSPQIHGDGEQLRDWLYVDDHCDAILRVLRRGRIGEIYNVAANEEHSVLEIAALIREELTATAIAPEHIADRLFQDRRFLISAEKIKAELAWKPEHNFRDALYQTVKSYEEFKFRSPKSVVGFQSEILSNI